MYKQGFSLIELLITISLIAIALAVFSPNYTSMINTQKKQTIAKTVIHFLSEARQQAIYKNSTVTVCPSLDNMQCFPTFDWANKNIIIFNDINTNTIVDNNEEIISQFILNQNKSSFIWKSFGNKPYLQWNSNGKTMYQNGNFTYCPTSRLPQHGLKIILNAAGRIYFGRDTNQDGIQEGTDGKNIEC